MHATTQIETPRGSTEQYIIYFRVNQIAKTVTIDGRTYIAPDAGQAGGIIRAVEKWVAPYGFSAGFYSVEEQIMSVPLLPSSSSDEESVSDRYQRMMAELSSSVAYLLALCRQETEQEGAEVTEPHSQKPSTHSGKVGPHIQRFLRFLAAKRSEVALRLGAPDGEAIEPPPVSASLGKAARRHGNEAEVRGKVTGYLEAHGVLIVNHNTYILGAQRIEVGTIVTIEVAQSNSGSLRIAAFRSVRESAEPTKRRRR